MPSLEPIYLLTHWEGPEDILFSTSVRKITCESNSCIMEEPASAGQTSQGGTAVTELGSLNAIRVIGSPGSRGQVTALSHQKQGGCGNGSRAREAIRIINSHRPKTLASYGVPTEKYIGRILNSFLICMNDKVLSQVNKSLKQIIKSESHGLSISSQTQASLWTQKPLNAEEAGFP